MKNIIKSMLILIFIIAAININIFADDTVYINQLEEKNKLFKEAIDNFGVSTKEEAINLYAEGVKQRSGPLQYSVMCKELKDKFSEDMEKNKNYAWVTGVSSPWVNKYKIIDTKKINNQTYSAKVEFFMNDANGLLGISTIKLKIKKCDTKWCIIEIEEAK